MTSDFPSASLPDGQMVCQTCREVLTHFQDGEHGQWRHRSPTTTHEVAPVPLVNAQDAVTVCDFCSAPAPAWAYPVDQRPTSSSLRGFTLNTDGWWTSCDLCADLIDAGDRRGLVVAASRRLRDVSAQHKRLPVALSERVVDEAHSTFWNRRAGARHLITRS